MITAISVALFAILAGMIWRRGPGAGLIAFGSAAAVAFATAGLAMITARYEWTFAWKVEAAFCGLGLTTALVALGILRD